MTKLREWFLRVFLGYPVETPVIELRRRLKALR
jgi:hypothetical protein